MPKKKIIRPEDVGMGRKAAVDIRDRNFPIAAMAPLREEILITRKYHNDQGAWLNQGNTYSCFPAGTLVTMMDGSEKPIDKVHPGEFVITHTGRPRMVSAVMARRHEGEVVATYFRGSHYPLVSTPDHKIYITPFKLEQYKRLATRGRLKAMSPVWKQAEDIKLVSRPKGGDYANCPIIKPVEICNTVDVEELLKGKVKINGDHVILKNSRKGAIKKSFSADYSFGKLMGLYLAEGHSRTKEDTINVALHLSFGRHKEDEIELANSTANEYREMFEAHTIVRERPSNNILVSVHSSTVAALMRALCGSFSHGKRLNNCVWLWSNEALKGIWDGFSLGDGYKRKRERGRKQESVEEVMTTVSEQLARDIWRIGNRLGYAPSLRIVPANTEKRKRTAYRVVAYHGVKTTMKPRTDEMIYCAAEKQERLPFEGLVYDLTVEEDHSFIAGGYIVHNCVGHGWAHLLEDGPIVQAGKAIAVDPFQIYREAQLRDEWPGSEPEYFGTSIRAGAKYLQELGYIKEYRWAFDVDTLARAILTVGPAVIGTNWYTSMFNPAVGGKISISGIVEGGHCTVINGANTVTRLFRGKNSWGKGWGNKGRFYISFDDMARLMQEHGEVCLPVEVKIPL